MTVTVILTVSWQLGTTSAKSISPVHSVSLLADHPQFEDISILKHFSGLQDFSVAI